MTLHSLGVRPHLIARLSYPGSYCSGVLVTPRTVLTCAHFFRGVDRLVTIDVAGTRRRAKDVETVPGTDVALVEVAPVKIPDDIAFPVLGQAPERFSHTATFGYGGRLSHPAARDGRYVSSLPFAVSRNLRTLVKPAGIVFNATPAVRGDSGGPVLAGGKVFAVQSLILEPFGINLGLATLALLDARVHAAVDTRRGRRPR